MSFCKVEAEENNNNNNIFFFFLIYIFYFPKVLADRFGRGFLSINRVWVRWRAFVECFLLRESVLCCCPEVTFECPEWSELSELNEKYDILFYILFFEHSYKYNCSTQIPSLTIPRSVSTANPCIQKQKLQKSQSDNPNIFGVLLSVSRVSWSWQSVTDLLFHDLLLQFLPRWPGVNSYPRV